MRDGDYTVSVDFLNGLFGETVQQVELRACPNVKGEPGAASLMTRDAKEVEAFCRRKDAMGLGVYFGVCTRRDGAESGDLSSVVECPALWVDIDCAKQEIKGQVALDALGFLPFPPSWIINSGGGLHAYWQLEDPVNVAEGNEARDVVVAALKALAHILAGDTKCAELARIMRLPGTHNSKEATLEIYEGEPALCSVVESTGRVYDFTELCRWLSTQRAVLQGKAEALRPVNEADPFVAYAREAGYEPGIDIDVALAAMEHGGAGDTSIHQTQLRVSASMIARGYSDDEIVDRLLAATERAAPHDKQWNWNAEDRAVRKMIATARGKGFDKPKERRTAAAPLSSGNLAVVHDLEEEREKRAQPKPEAGKESKSATVQVGKAAIGVWKERHGPVMHTDGLTYAYESGIWEQWNDRLAQRLRAIIQEACASLGYEPKTALLNAAKAYFMDRPELIHADVRFDAHGLIITDDCTVDPATGQIGEHSPDHFARYKVGAKARGDHNCRTWLGFLKETFSDRPDDEARAIIATVQEWFGSTLVIDKSRAARMALLAHGPSRTGKTQIAEAARGLLGAKYVCGAPMRDLEGRFGLEPFLGKRGWVTDDAVGEGEFMDADVYKKIVTGEKMSVQCKGGRNVEVAFGFPVCVTMNNLPRVKEQSEAVYNRSLVLPCTHVRPENAPEPVGYNSIAEKIIAEEMTGILWWAFEGWQRLFARGHYAAPKTMTDARKGFEADNNPVGSWREECLEFDPQYKVSRPDLLASMNGWWSQEYGVDQKPWSGRGFFPRLFKMIPGYDPKASETTNDLGTRHLIGVRLKPAGLIAWRTYKDSKYGQASKISDDETYVNRDHLAPPAEAPVATDRRPRF